MNFSPIETHSVPYAPEPTRKRMYASNAFMIFGLVVTLLVVMFRPSGAEAVLPTSATVFDRYDATTGAAVKFSDLPKITSEYDVVFNGQKQPSKVALTGVPLIEFLRAAGADTGGVSFVRIRFGRTGDNVSTDASLALIPLDKGSGRPGMVLDSGRDPKTGALPTPALVPGQPTASPISQRQIIPFDRRDTDLTIIPARPGAEIFSVRIASKKTKAGQFRLTARVGSGTSGALKYEWYAADSNGNVAVVGNKSTYTTTDATSGTQKRSVNVVVTQTNTGSMGTRSFGYTSRKADDGKTTNPQPSGGNDGGSGTGTGTGTGPGTGNGVIPPTLSTPAPSTGTPQFTPPPTTTPQTPPTEPVPDPTVQSDQDTTAITNVAQNVSGTGSLISVSGVLLSSPTIAPAGGGGAPITELPAPVADELNSLFQPVEDPGDIWPYLLAILFATTLAGAIRESISP